MAGQVFQALVRPESMHDGYLAMFNVNGQTLVVVQQAGQPSVLEGICPHAGHPLGNSRLIGASLRCDMHGYLFDAATGECTYYTEGPCRALRVYPWEVREGWLGVMLTDAPEGPPGVGGGPRHAAR